MGNESLTFKQIIDNEEIEVDRDNLKKLYIQDKDDLKIKIIQTITDEFLNMYNDEDAKEILDTDSKIDFIFRKYLKNCIKQIGKL